MSRLPLHDVEELPEELRSLHDDAEEGNWQLRHVTRAFAPAPELLTSFLDWYYPWHSSDPSTAARLSPRLKELIRLRLATFSGCKLCKSARLAEDVIPEAQAANVDAFAEAEDYSPAEKAGLAFAEKMALDHFSLDDRDFTALREHFDDAQILELVMMAAIVGIGFGRALSVLQLDDVSCPLPAHPVAAGGHRAAEEPAAPRLERA